MTPLANSQAIDASFDENALLALSIAQNGCASLETVRDEAGARAGYLSAYPIDLSKYVAPAVTSGQQFLLDYASERQNAILAQSWSFNVAASGAAEHVVTTRLDPRGESAMMKLGIWLQLNAAHSENLTMPYSNVDSSTTTLSYAEVASLVAQTGAFDIKSYSIFNPVCDQIRAGALTTKEQVDLALARIAL